MCLWLGLGWGDWAQGLCSRSHIRRAVTGDSGPSSSALVFLPVLGPRSAWIFRHGPWDSGRGPLFFQLALTVVKGLQRYWMHGRETSFGQMFMCRPAGITLC